MDFPLFYIDHLAGGRLIIGIIATLHVLINHPLAVGAYPLLTYMEWWAHKNNRPELDELAYKITFVVFIVTTTVGAMTGVGIWLSTSLFAPFAIGSLLRVFFFGWFAEWLVFISEVGLILAWFLTWKHWKEPARKSKHIRLGIALSVMSWLTMALIVAVLGFMMKPGQWNQTKAFVDAMTNPLYLPQLGFRTFFALMTGAVFIWFAAFFFTKDKADLRAWLVLRLSYVTLASLVVMLGFGAWYWHRIPDVMRANSSVAILTQQFVAWHEQFYTVLGLSVVAFLVISLNGIFRPRHVPRFALLIPTFMGIWLLSHFERSREFMRKPWVIGEYLYSNGIRKDELEFFQSEGILKYSAFSGHNAPTPWNPAEAGQDVFMITCSRCHSTSGMNGVLNKFTAMYGEGEWDSNAMKSFILNMHNTRTFMPPFPGNETEAEALVAFIQYLRKSGSSLTGAQTDGARVPNATDAKMVLKLVPFAGPAAEVD